MQLQRGKAARRQLASSSMSSRGHAYELIEHKKRARMVRNITGQTDKQHGKWSRHKLKTSSEEPGRKFTAEFCKSNPPILENLKTRKDRVNAAMALFLLLWAKVCVVG